VLPLNLDNTAPDYTYLGELLRATGLESKRRAFPHELSGGQQQRVAFVRALIHKPEIILADEPTGNLDSKNTAEIMELFRRSNRELKQTILIITHDEDIAEQCDRVITLRDGKIISDVTKNAPEEAERNEI